MKGRFLLLIMMAGIVLSLLAAAQTQPVTAPTEGGIITARLILEDRSLDLGFETFGLQQRFDGTFRLVSSDFFATKGPALVQFQDLKLDAEFRPLEYTLFQRLPNGQEQLVRAEIQGDRATLRLEGPEGERREVTVTASEGREFLLLDPNVLSHDWVAWKRFFQSGRDSIAVLRLRPQNLDSPTQPLTLTRVGKAVLRTGETQIEADEVLVSSEGVPFIRLFGLEGQWIASLYLSGPDQPESLTFRGDLFPRGLEVVR